MILVSLVVLVGLARPVLRDEATLRRRRAAQRRQDDPLRLRIEAATGLPSPAIDTDDALLVPRRQLRTLLELVDAQPTNVAFLDRYRPGRSATS